LAGLTHLLVITDRCPEQRPEGEARETGAGGATRRQETLDNDMRAGLTEEVSCLAAGKIPEVRIPDVVAG
jgi:hypothetical protein